MTLKEIDKKIKKHLPQIRKKYKVKSLGIFGSFVREEQKRESDIDILVEFSEVITLFEFIELENFLSEILGIKVDLVMKDALKPRIKDRVLKEVVPI